MRMKTIHIERVYLRGKDSFRIRLICGTLGIAQKDYASFRQDLNMPEENPVANWKIGAIVGVSGSGKTTLALAAYPTAIWPEPLSALDGELAVIDALVEGVQGCWPLELLLQILTQVGLGSAWVWMQTVPSLSEGEKFRFQMARQILRGIAAQVAQETKRPLTLVVDEFTCGLDVLTARNVCWTLEKWLRGAGAEYGLRLIVVSCRAEVVDWLNADWQMTLPAGVLVQGPFRKCGLTLQVNRCKRSMWQAFVKHHYLSGDLAQGVECFVASEGKDPVAFCAAGAMWGHRNMRRIVRLVTMPAYQGLGIAKKLLRWVANYLQSEGHDVRLTTGHPALARSLVSDDAWNIKELKKVGSSAHGTRNRDVATSRGRPVVSFQYVGEGLQ